MSGRSANIADFLRANGISVAVGAALLAVIALGARWIASNRAEGTPPRKVMQFAVVNVQPAQPPKPPPPPPPQPAAPPKEIDAPQPNRVELNATDIPPPEAAPPSPGAPAAGPLALAATGEGPGDAFNLVGNPGGRALLSGGGLGDGSGGGLGRGDATARYAWYYAKMQPDIEAALRGCKRLSSASVRMELRIWWDASGRITRVQPVRSGDPAVDAELQTLVGLRLRQPPPSDVPMPVVMRLNARRPQ